MIKIYVEKIWGERENEKSLQLNTLVKVWYGLDDHCLSPDTENCPKVVIDISP